MISASGGSAMEVEFPWCESATFLPRVSELCWASVAWAVSGLNACGD